MAADPMIADPVVAVGPMTPVVHEVVSVWPETEDTVTFVIESQGDPLSPARPGQFNMLWIPGVGEVPISLAGIDGPRVTHTVRGVGAVTRALCDLRPGDELGVRGPYGRGWDLDRAIGHDLLIVAGGLGLVPLRPVVQRVLADRASFGAVSLLVGARSPESLMYLDELDDWADAIDVAVTVDMATLPWRGHVGVVTELLPGASTDPAREIAFVCGPEVMMRVVADAVVQRGTSAHDVSVSLERNMHCGIGHCGRCQLGPVLLCREGPVVPWAAMGHELSVRGR